jgi:hypothetical protein
MTIERGEYLVTTIGACDNCHPRRIDSVFGGKVVPGTELSGGFEFSDPDIGPIVSPISPQKSPPGLASGLMPRLSMRCAMPTPVMASYRIMTRWRLRPTS